MLNPRRVLVPLGDRELFYESPSVPVPGLEYNRLKVLVLELISSQGELASEQILKLLGNSGVQLSDKGLRMALMRYTRQGLLARVKSQGRYHYSITVKGSARREWLLKTK